MENLSGFQILELPKSDEQTPFNEKKRICKIHYCGTILSRFNLGSYCHAHKPLAILSKRDNFIKKIDCKKLARKEK